MLWIKALHIISIVAWFAGLFYLPRLFVYHSQAEDNISLERFKLMEKRLYYSIMMPAMILSFIFGFWLLADEPFYLTAAWLNIKLILVLSLIIYHFYCGYLMKLFKEDRNTHSHVFYRWLNEYPTVALVSIVILAVVKP